MSHPMDGFDSNAPRGLNERDRQLRAQQRRAAVQHLAGWPHVDAAVFRELCAALGLDPREGRERAA